MLFIVHFLDKTPIHAFWDTLGQCWLWNEGSSWYGFQILEMRVAIVSPICLWVGRAGGRKALEGYIRSNELSLSFNSLKLSFAHHVFCFNLFPDRTGAAVQVPSSFHADQISSFQLLPLCQPPAVRGFPLTGSGALLYPPDSLAVFQVSLAWAQCHCWDICTGWHERPSSSSSSLLLPLSNGSSLCFIPLSSCPSHPRTFLPSTSLLPRSPLHLPTPSLLTSSCPPLAICRKHYGSPRVWSRAGRGLSFPQEELCAMRCVQTESW